MQENEHVVWTLQPTQSQFEINLNKFLSSSVPPDLKYLALGGKRAGTWRLPGESTPRNSIQSHLALSPPNRSRFNWS